VNFNTFISIVNFQTFLNTFLHKLLSVNFPWNWVYLQKSTLKLRVVPVI